MYNLLKDIVTSNEMLMLGIIVAFVLTFLCLKFPWSFLPADQGRAFAINGAQSKGKIRGVGLPFVICFIVASLLFLPISREYIIYMIRPRRRGTITRRARSIWCLP